MSSTTVVTMPDSASSFIREIDRLGLKYQYVPQYDISQIDLEKRRVQVRESEHYAPAPTVKEFAQSLRAGTILPPVVVTSDHYMIDGNTRTEAARFNKMPYFHALVIPRPYDGASLETVDKFKALAATLNQTNGVRLTRAEAKTAAISLLRLGWTIQNIQRALGLNPGVAYKVSREQAALERTKRLGLDLPEAYLDLAGSKQMLALNDEPYKRLALLMVDAGLKAREVKEIAEEVKNAGSDEAAVDILKQYRTDFEERILDRALTGNGKPPPGAKFRQALGRVLSYEGAEDKGVERIDSQREEHMQQLERAKVVLEKVIALQRDLFNV